MGGRQQFLGLGKVPVFFLGGVFLLGREIFLSEIFLFGINKIIRNIHFRLISKLILFANQKRNIKTKRKGKQK